MVKYGATIENLDIISAKAKTKRDGIYSFRGVEYRVRSHRMTHFAHRGEIHEVFGNFTVVVGRYESYGAKDALKQL
jgi:hypothetical protein